MEDENKRISYSQFKECVCKDLKMYFSDPELRKQNYEVRIREDKDAYDTSEELMYLCDLKNPDKKVPEYSLSVIYETYCCSRNLSEVIKALAETVVKQYPREQKLEEEVRSTPMRSIIRELNGYPEENIGTVYLITDASGRRGAAELIQDDDMLAGIAEKEQSNLQIIEVDDTALMVIPVMSEVEMEDNREVMSELQHMVRRELEEEYRLYDRNKNLLLSDIEDIKELLEKGKDRKKGVFSR